jgi:transposase
MVYQLDEDNRRLLWVVLERKKESIKAFFSIFKGALSDIRYVCSDM